MQEVVVLYIHERFLFRLGRSHHCDRLILKGGMLLAVLDCRRPTADVDLLARRVSNDEEEIARLVTDILTAEVDDGVSFDAGRMTTRLIRTEDLYSGVRLSIPQECIVRKAAAH